MEFRYVIRRLRTLAVLLLVLTDIVQGFQNGAGGCAGGEPAVGGYHIDKSDNRTVNSGTFEDAGVVVTLDNVVLLPNTATEENPQFEIEKDLVLRVEVVDFALRGILVRMEAQVEGILTPGASLKVAEVCELPILGTTHANNTDKESVESTVRFDEPADDVIFDITVVFLNSPVGSVYVYDRFFVNFFGASSPSPSTQVPNITTPAPSSAATTASPTPALTTFSPSNGTTTTGLPTTLAPSTGAPSSLDTDPPSAEGEATGAPSKPSGEQEPPTESEPHQPGGDGSKRKGSKSPKSKSGKGSQPKGDIGNDPSRSNTRDKKKKKDPSARQLRYDH